MSTLADLVSSALVAANTNIKVASAHDAAVGDAGFLDTALGIDTPAPKTPAKTASAQRQPSPSAILDDAAYGMKIAEALESAASILDLPGPEVQESPFANTPATHPTAQSNLPANEKTHGSGPLGPVGELPTNDTIPGQKSASWAKDKTAALSMITAKVAQAEVLMEMGQKTAAQVLLNDVKSIRAKLAADPSSPDANIAGRGTGFMLPTEIDHASQVPDNAGMATITKAKAVNPSVQEAGTFISETPKVDNAVPAAVTHTEGQKVSSFQALVKVARELSEAPGMFESNATQTRAVRESVPFNAGILGVSGGLMGGGVGAQTGANIAHKMHASSKGQMAAALGGGLVGAAAGGTGGALLGRGMAHGEQDSRKRLEQAAVAKALAKHQKPAEEKTAAFGATKKMLAIAADAGKAGGGAVPLATGIQAAARGSAGKVNRGAFKLSHQEKFAGTAALLRAVKATEGQAVKPLTRDMLASGAQAAARGSAGKVGRTAGAVAGGIR